MSLIGIKNKNVQKELDKKTAPRIIRFLMILIILDEIKNWPFY